MIASFLFFKDSFHACCEKYSSKLDISRSLILLSLRQISKILTLAVKNIQVNLIFLARLFVSLQRMRTEKKYSLPQSERLKGKIRIDNLFANAKGVLAYPYRVLFTPNGTDKNIIMVSIPKRKFKHAVDRNLLRRRTREAYRLNKTLLSEQTNSIGLDIAFLYIGDKKEEFKYLQKKMCDALNKIASKISEENKTTIDNQSEGQ